MRKIQNSTPEALETVALFPLEVATRGVLEALMPLNAEQRRRVIWAAYILCKLPLEKP